MPRITASHAQSPLEIVYKYAEDANVYARNEFSVPPNVVLHTATCKKYRMHAEIRGNAATIFYPLNCNLSDGVPKGALEPHACIHVKMCENATNDVVAQFCAMALFQNGVRRIVQDKISEIPTICQHNAVAKDWSPSKNRYTYNGCFSPRAAKNRVSVQPLAEHYLNQMLEGVYTMKKNSAAEQQVSENIVNAAITAPAATVNAIPIATNGYTVQVRFVNRDNAEMLAYKLRSLGYEGAVVEG